MTPGLLEKLKHELNAYILLIVQDFVNETGMS